MHIEYTAEQTALQPKLEAANINPESFLATDYLNHYNEIVMLLEMIPDMPDMVEDAAEWQPKSYAQHFQDSGFQDTELAIEAFEKAPNLIRNAFSAVCKQIDTIILSTIAGLNALNAAERGLSGAASDLIRQRVKDSQELLLKLNQVVHGKIDDEESFVGSLDIDDSPEADEVQSQEDIDKLFD